MRVSKVNHSSEKKEIGKSEVQTNEITPSEEQKK